MPRKYDIENPKDIESLNRVCNVYGIHFEKDLLNQTYVLLDHVAYFPEKQEYARRRRKLKKNVRV